ncbi:hypothetical protein JJV70_01925 [Streptomyces sp. JJ66]|uniref:hypothetical protein n=1 Tax=Streptomyces sp. JJ66 TaxID=2803843 RepID=UPI001C59C0DB|nr:hypothetical protein [Streptomyces sp. JJ66]MBW1600878.1 hypothetical protein [Streptomyces sp. JJ66]
MKSLITRATQSYWALNVRVWEALRPAHAALLALVGTASLALWMAGVITGRYELGVPLVAVSLTWLLAEALTGRHSPRTHR